MTAPTGKPRGRPRSATRDDGPYENVFLNVGNGGDRSAFTRAVTPRLLQFAELENLYSGDGFARRIIDLPAEEMVRAGYDIEGVDGDGDIRAALEGLQALEKLADAMRWASLYGGSLVVIAIVALPGLLAGMVTGLRKPIDLP
jgi:hypothetical protein